MAFDSSLLLYTLQVLKDDKQEVTSHAEDLGAPAPTPTPPLPSEAASIPSFVETVQTPHTRSRPLFVADIEWRAEPCMRLYHEYIIIHVSDSIQSAPTTTIRIDRNGKLGIKTPWWHPRPIYFFSNTKRVSTTVLARPTGDPITDPTTGTSVLKYTHWIHAVPPLAPISDLKRALERMRINACTALNHAVRPYVPHSSHMSDKEIRYGRCWADSRRLRFVHTDIARSLARAMDARMIRCLLQALWTGALPSWLVWPSVQRSVRIRQEYLHVVDEYRRELALLAQSFSSFGPEVQTKVALSWGINENEKQSSALIRLLSGSLSNYAFINPYAPTATLSDVASRLDALFPILPAFGPAQDLCELYSDTLTARLSGKLWHAYAVSTHPVPTSSLCAIKRRARNSRLFGLSVDALMQWLVALFLLPQDSAHGLWAICTVMYHAFFICLWALRIDKVWRRIWKAYEPEIVQGQEDMWHESGTLSSMWSQSKASFWSKKWDKGYVEIPLAVFSN